MKITKEALKKIIKEELEEVATPPAERLAPFDPADFIPELYKIMSRASRSAGALDNYEKETLLQLLTHLLDAASASNLGANATLKRWLGMADDELEKMAAKK